MVRILNPSRQTQRIEFGKESDEPEYDQNDNPKPTITVLWTTLAIPYTLNTTQIIQAQGLNLADQRIYAVRHRLDSFWDQISRVKINGELYEVIHINPDEENSPTSYDLVTVKKVTEHG